MNFFRARHWDLQFVEVERRLAAGIHDDLLAPQNQRDGIGQILQAIGRNDHRALIVGVDDIVVMDTSTGLPNSTT